MLYQILLPNNFIKSYYFSFRVFWIMEKIMNVCSTYMVTVSCNTPIEDFLVLQNICKVSIGKNMSIWISENLLFVSIKTFLLSLKWQAFLCNIYNRTYSILHVISRIMYTIVA